MVDVVAATVFGHRSGSLDNWATGVRDPLSIAVYDFPKRGIMVSNESPRRDVVFLVALCSAVQFPPGRGISSAASPTPASAKFATRTRSWLR